MPYLKQEERGGLRELADAAGLIIKDRPIGQRAGAINYLIFRMFTKIFDTPRHGLTWIPPKGSHDYAQLNEMIGALECCKLELYKRLVGPYESFKAEENGDII